VIALRTSVLQQQGFANISSDGGATQTRTNPIPGTPTFFLNASLSCDETTTNCTATGIAPNVVIYNSSDSGLNWIQASSVPYGNAVFLNAIAMDKMINHF